jgi:hypothetical protein
MGNLNLVISNQSDGIVSVNETVFEHDLTVNANMSAIVAGPVTIPNVTVNGNLNVIGDLTVTTDTEVSGTLNITG